MWCDSTCRLSNPATDSVYVDPTAIAPDSARRDAAALAQDAARRFQEETEQAERCHEEELQRLRAEEEAEEAREREERERLRREQEAAEAARVVAKERLREEVLLAFEQEQRRMEQEQQLKEQEQQREHEEQDRRKEAERREREQMQEKESQLRREAVKSFCQQHGFRTATEPRLRGCSVFGSSVTYPLHQAAELADARIVELLLKEGASPMMKNGSKQTAAQVAQKMNKNGSHDGVLQALKIAATGGA